ncbi:MAG: twin-arginine translocase TatA/TatE family subunit [Flavobacteriales bacterium]
MTTKLMFLNMGLGEMLLIMLVVLMFFGTKSIPDIARTLGRAMRQIRDAGNEVKREIRDSAEKISKEAGIDDLKESSGINSIKDDIKLDQHLED